MHILILFLLKCFLFSKLEVDRWQSWVPSERGDKPQHNQNTGVHKDEDSIWCCEWRQNIKDMIHQTPDPRVGLTPWLLRPNTISPSSPSLSSGGKIRKSPELTTFNWGHLNRCQLLSWTFVSSNSPDRVSKLQFNCYSLENYQWKWLPMVLFWRWQYFQNVSFPFPTISR